MRKSRKKNTAIPNDGDPWSPVDYVDVIVARQPVTPPEPLEIKGGDVTAHIDLGTGPTEEELADGEAQKAQEFADEMEEAEKILAEKLAALDSARTKK